MKNYIPLWAKLSESMQAEYLKLIESGVCDGFEIYIANFIPRDQSLNEKDIEKLKYLFSGSYVKRMHMSYWAETSDFLEHLNYDALRNRFGNEESIRRYYGDLNGDAIYERWINEYLIASKFGLESVTFHLIEYMHIDGLWEIENNRNDIVVAHARILSQLLDKLDHAGLLEKGPTIEIENAGFCLEYGVQTAEDFEIVFRLIDDKYKKVKIAWDINHLLHAIGFDEKSKKGKFFLAQKEMTRNIIKIERKYGHDWDELVENWLGHNILFSTLQDKIGTIHISDCNVRSRHIFRNGRLCGDYFEKIRDLQTDEDKEEYGTKLVKKYFDSHIFLGRNSAAIIRVIESIENDCNVLHEIREDLNVERFKSQILSLRTFEENI